MSYIAYILINKFKNKTYAGHTNDINRRLNEHNSGKTIFTKKYVPWSILYQEEFETLNESIKREKYFKYAAGRRWIKKNLFM